MVVQVIAGDRAQVCHVANDLMMIGMHMKSRLLDGFTYSEHRFILVSFAFRDDDRAFRRNLLRIEETDGKSVV